MSMEMGAKLSSMGHAGNLVEDSGGGGGGGAATEMGVFAKTIKYNTDIGETLKYIGSSNFLKTIPFWDAFTSLFEMKIFPPSLETASQYLAGLIGNLPSPLSTMPTGPIGGGKAQGGGH